MTAQAATDARTLTYAKALNEALALEMVRDHSVVVLGEDVAAPGGMYTVTKGLLDRFGPDRVIDTPIAEGGFVGLGAGAAIAGLRPVVELMFVDFALVAADQLLNQAAKVRFLSADRARVPLTVRTQQGIASGGGAQHSQSMEAIFAHVPGFAIALPSTPADAKGLLTAAIRDDDPVMVIEHKALYFTKGDVPEGEHVVPLGEACTRRAGDDVTIATYSAMVPVALEAAEALATVGIEAEVIDLRTIVPLDLEAIRRSVARTGRLVVVHEAPLTAGMGAEVVARATEAAWGDLRAAPARVGGLDMPVPYARSLEARWKVQADDIQAAVHRVLE